MRQPPAQLDRRNAGRETAGGRTRGHSEDQLATTVTVVDARQVEPTKRAAQCLRRARDHAAVGPVVVARRREWRERHVPCFIRAECLSPAIGAAAATEARDMWCGIAVGRLRARATPGPAARLAGCRDAAADPVAFAWVEPGRATQYVAVGQPGLREVYRVVSGPSGAHHDDLRYRSREGSRASFRITEHDGERPALARVHPRGSRGWLSLTTRERDGERRAFARRRGDCERSAVSVDDRARQREPEPGSARGWIEPDAELEDAVELVRRDPGPSSRTPISDGAREPRPVSTRGRPRDRARRRVSNEIVERLPKADRIGVDRPVAHRPP